MSDTFKQHGVHNHIEVGANITLAGHVLGDHNRIVIRDSAYRSVVHIFISGNGNQVFIDKESEIKGLGIMCGNHVPAHGTRIHIGAEFTIEAGGRFYLYNSGNVLEIGDECMFSSNITLRGGESPHLIFDKDSGEYLDQSEGVFIGRHVWVGEGVYITKSASIADESVVGARSVVTRRFVQPHVAIAGNPARVVRENLQWIRNPGLLEEGSPFQAAYQSWWARFPARRPESAAMLGEPG
jgi:acetyltransferase-like isoleucine patch superfamily enzyme